MIERASDSEILKREVEQLLKEHKIKYDSIDKTYDNQLFISVSTYKRAKDTIRVLMNESLVDEIFYSKMEDKIYGIRVSFEFLPIKH